jgi:hypothetical protein
MPLDLKDKVFLLGPCIDNGGTAPIFENYDLIPLSANIFGQWVANAKEISRLNTSTNPTSEPVYQTGLRRGFLGGAHAEVPPTLSAYTVLGATFLQNIYPAPYFSTDALDFSNEAFYEDFSPFTFIIHNKQFFLQYPTPSYPEAPQFVSITDTVFVRQSTYTYSTPEGTVTYVGTETFTITDTYFTP